MAKRRTYNTMAKRRRTYNTMAKRRAYNTIAKRRAYNTMAKSKGHTTQWPKVKDRQRIMITPLVSLNFSYKKRLNKDSQQFHHYQQNEQPPQTIEQ
jgi:hypothetical protein